MAKDTKRPKVHPVVAKLAKLAKDDSIVALEGFVGEGGSSVIRVHPALGGADYTEVAEDAVIHIEDDIDTRGRVRLWVKGSAKLQVVTTRRADAQMGSGGAMARLAGGGGVGLGAMGGFGFFGDMWRCLQMASEAYNHCLRTNPRLEHDPTVCDQYAAEMFRQCMAGERKLSPF